MRIAETVTFGGSGLDRAAALRGDPEAMAARLATGTVLPVWRGKPLLAGTETCAAGWVPASHPALAHGGPVVFLGLDEGIARFAQDISSWSPEAGAEAIVPTSSTTMTLAMGDALAVALMQHRAFTAVHFRAFHPGGPLGAKLLRVADVMHTGMPLVAASAPMSEAILTISQKGFGVVGVQDAQGNLVGIITDGDLRRHMDGLMGMTAGDVMTRSPRSLAPDALAGSALALMTQAQITCLFVIDPAAPQRARGIVHIHDFLRAGVI